MLSYQEQLTIHSYIDEVVDAYLQFALYYQNDSNGIPLAVTKDVEDLDVDVLADTYAQVSDFCIELRKSTKKDFEPIQLGIDLYTTVNGGIGFTDKLDVYGEYGEYAEKLAKKYQRIKLG